MPHSACRTNAQSKSFCLGLGVILAAAFAWTDVPGDLRIIEDFIHEWHSATIDNADESTAKPTETCGNRSLPAIFLHPKGEGDAVAHFTGISLPPTGVAENERVFLLFRLGFRDGVPWNDTERPPNGVQFLVKVNEVERLNEVLAGPGWQPRAIEVTSEARAAAFGNHLTISFGVNALDGNTNYDWALYGDPMLVRFAGMPSPEGLSERAAGIVLARVTATAETEATLGAGDGQTHITLAPGTHWIPVHFNTPGILGIEGKGLEMGEVLYARHTPNLLVEEFSLSTPLIIAEEPFNVVLELRNTGRGRAETERTYGLTGVSGTPGAALPLIEPGARARVVWRDVSVQTPGEHTVEVDQGDAKTLPLLPLNFHAFPSPERKTPGPPAFGVTLGGERNQARLMLYKDASREMYAVAEVWNGAAFQTVGALYPLAEATLLVGGEASAPKRVRGRFRNARIDLKEDNAELLGDIEGVPVRISFAASPEGRFGVRCELLPPEDIEVSSFHAPRFLAGQQAFGVAKDFALFPGLEYLEGREGSSSERDLAYPLSERRVPALHKITTPLMAVQADGALAAMLWDIHQVWAGQERYPSAFFDAPGPESGYECIAMNLFAPSVGVYVEENHDEAFHPYLLPANEVLQLNCLFVLDHLSRHEAEDARLVTRPGGLVLQAFRHYFDVFGLPAPSAQPRSWEEEQTLALDAYFNAVWNDNPPGWRHCYNWTPDLFVGHALPQLVLKSIEGNEDQDARIDQHVEAVLDRALTEKGPGFFANGAGCHIALGELPFYWGFPAESMLTARQHGMDLLNARENGLWVWRPDSTDHARLGVAGDHTLGQAAQPAYVALRAARLSGDPALAAQALDAFRQVQRYNLPRGAQTWECPLYQPDILAAAQAIRASCEAYRLTGNDAYLAEARYWAWTGFPFLYLWDLPRYPTMRYNVVSVIGSTFYTHSWLGLPVVWCGLVYAYALQELAEHDTSFDWKRVAQGITNSAMWQQYADGPNRGTYPDSWNMIENRPNPADIGPESILMNELRLRGASPEIRTVRLSRADAAQTTLFVNSAADIQHVEWIDGGEGLEIILQHALDQAYTLVVPVAAPATVEGAGNPLADGRALHETAGGWYYAPEIRAVVIKTAKQNPVKAQTISLRWTSGAFAP